VSDFENERDPGTLRQIARLLLLENERLHERLEELVAENARLKGHTASEQLALELSSLQEQMARLQKQLYGVSSERRHKAGDAGEKPTRSRRGHGPTPQERLPVESVLITIPPEERVCDHCGGALKAIEGGTEDSERVTVVERRFVVQELRRQKYRCDCGIGLCTAPPPLTHMPGGRYSLEFAIHAAVEKYLQHQPLDRQRRAMERMGLRITTQALWDQIEALATIWQPAYELLRHYILGDDVIGVDETWWWMMDHKPSKKWWVWSLTCPSAAWYRIAPQRSAKLAASLVEGYTGTLVCDAYRAYETLAKENKNLRLALCWSHARRHFIEAERNYPQCDKAIALIGKLFVSVHAATAVFPES
jgi:transposase